MAVAEVVVRGLGRGRRLMPAREGGGVRRGLKEDMVRELDKLLFRSGDAVCKEDESIGWRRDRHGGMVVLPLWRTTNKVDAMVMVYYFVRRSATATATAATSDESVLSYLPSDIT